MAPHLDIPGDYCKARPQTDTQSRNVTRIDALIDAGHLAAPQELLEAILLGVHSARTHHTGLLGNYCDVSPSRLLRRGLPRRYLIAMIAKVPR